MKQPIFKNYPCRLEEEEKHIFPSFLISLNFDNSNRHIFKKSTFKKMKVKKIL
jgi:hypothetical protein